MMPKDSILLRHIESIDINISKMKVSVETLTKIDSKQSFLDSLTADGIAAALIAIFTTLLAQLLSWLFQNFKEGQKRRELRDFFLKNIDGIVKTNDKINPDIRNIFKGGERSR
jgi:hypothetical protein